MCDGEGTDRKVWEWLETATATLPDNQTARAMRQELYDHFEEVRQELLEAGYSSDEAVREAMVRLGPADALCSEWHRRVGDPRVLPWTFWGLAAIVFMAGLVKHWMIGVQLGLLLGVFAIGSRWRDGWSRLVVTGRFWWAMMHGISKETVGTGVVAGVVLGSEPLWAGQWLDYVWHPWVLPFGVLFVGTTVLSARRAAERSDCSPQAATGSASIGLIGGLLIGAVAGLTLVATVFSHGNFPMQGALPNWPWPQVWGYATHDLLIGIGLYVALVLGVGVERLRRRQASPQDLTPEHEKGLGTSSNLT